MKEMASTQDLEKFLGYSFCDLKILEEARRRKAFLNENPAQDEECMDPLATLGDAVLDVIAINRLYELGVRTKGELTICKNRQVKREQTRTFAHENNLHEYVQWGEGELKQKNWLQGDKALDTVTEALIGAVYLDAQKRGLNGMTVVKEMLERMNFF